MEKIKEEEIQRVKLWQLEQEEHETKIKILAQSYEVEIKIEEAKLEWLRQDWGEGKPFNNEEIMKNLRKQLEEAEKAKLDAEDLKQQEWERAKAMIQDGLNERRKVDQLADETEKFLRNLDAIQNDNGFRPFSIPNLNNSSVIPPEFERLCQQKYGQLHDKMMDREFPNMAKDEPFGEDEEEDLMGLGESDIADMQKELFKEPSIDFIPRKNEPIDELLAEAIEEMNIKIPIVWVKGNIYQVGSQKLVLHIQRNCLFIKFAEGQRSFHDYIIKSEKFIQRVLTIFALKSGESIDMVMDALIKDKQIRGVGS